MVKKIMSVFIVTVMLITVYTTNIYAFNTFDDHVLLGGVGDYGANRRYYWIAESALSLEGLIDQAVYEWIYTSTTPGVTTPISFRQTVQASVSVMDFHYDTFQSPYTYTYARARHFDLGGECYSYLEDWKWTTVEMNKLQFSKLPTSGTYGNQQLGCISHEIGHCFGLDHTYSSTYNIMYDGDYTRRVTRAQKDDLNGINYLY